MASWKSLRTGEGEAEFRQLWSYFYEQVSPGKAKTGVVTGLAVTATTPSASGSVNVDTGLALCQPTSGGGAFPMPNTSSTLDVFTANPMQFVSNPRNDIVILDQTDGAVKVLTGAPNATPALGEQAVPATAVPLARLRHASGATTIPATAIDDLRVTVVPFGLQTPGPWVTLTINTSGGSWSALTGSEPQARLLPYGRVELRGAVQAGSTISRTDPLQLPVEMRPAALRWLPATRTSGAASGRTVTATVSNTGVLNFSTTYAESGALQTSVAYPITGTFSL